MTAISIDPKLAQRRQALEKANWIRSRRSRLKRAVRAGEQAVGPLIAEPPEWLGTMSVRELLMAAPKVGRTKSGSMLRCAGVPVSATVRSLTERQRQGLVEALEPRRS